MPTPYEKPANQREMYLKDREMQTKEGRDILIEYGRSAEEVSLLSPEALLQKMVELVDSGQVGMTKPIARWLVKEAHIQGWQIETISMTSPRHQEKNLKMGMKHALVQSLNGQVARHLFLDPKANQSLPSSEIVQAIKSAQLYLHPELQKPPKNLH